MFSFAFLPFFGRPYFVKVEPMSSHVVCLSSSSSSSSVTFCIVAKRYILAKNCLKEQIGYPPETTPRYQFGPHIHPLRGNIPPKRVCLLPCVDVYITCNHRTFSRNIVNLATTCCSCLVDVGLIRRSFREDGIKVLMLSVDIMCVRPICSPPTTIGGLRTAPHCTQ